MKVASKAPCLDRGKITLVSLVKCLDFKLWLQVALHANRQRCEETVARRRAVTAASLSRVKEQIKACRSISSLANACCNNSISNREQTWLRHLQHICLFIAFNLFTHLTYSTLAWFWLFHNVTWLLPQVSNRHFHNNRVGSINGLFCLPGR